MTEAQNDNRDKARRIYDEKVAPLLPPADAEKFVAIDTVSGDFTINADRLVAAQEVCSRHKGSFLFIVKAGFLPVASIRLIPFRRPIEEEPWFKAI